MNLGNFEKDVDEKIDYTIDWSKRLNGNTVSSVTHTATPVGLTLESESNTSTTTMARFSGGTDGVKYKVEVDVATSDGEQVQHEFYIHVLER